MIIDTSPLVAALNRRESNHELAVSVLEEAGAGARIPEAVLVEVDHLTRSQRPADPPVLALLNAISAGEHRFAPVGLDLLEAVSVLDRQHVDLQLGLTDCIVMSLASRLGEPVFTFDFRDFRAVTVGGRPLDLVVSEADAGR